MVSSQTTIFIIFIFNGIIIGIIFDLFRILRKSFKTSFFITSIQDIIFWLITGIIILYSIFFFNNGIIRGYIFLGIFFGLIFYMLLLSKIFININVIIINFFKKILIKIFNIIYFPLKIVFKFLKKNIFRPISFIFINIHNFNKKFLRNKKIKEGFSKKV